MYIFRAFGGDFNCMYTCIEWWNEQTITFSDLSNYVWFLQSIYEEIVKTKS